MRRLASICCLLFGIQLHAQSVQQFSVTTTAVSLTTQVQTAPAADIGFRFQATQNLAFRQENITSPTANGGDSVNIFAAGFEWSGKPFDSVISKIKLDSKKFQLYVTGSLGVDRVTDHTGDVHQHITGLAGGGLRYDPTGSGTFSVTLAEVRYGWLPGLTGATTNNVILFQTGVRFAIH